jgi:YidC/Oxa1 family membrane protein insertase
VLDPLYHLAANAIVFFHRGFGPIFGQTSFFAWAFSVVTLVVCVRIVIFPLFVKQIKSQRKMQMLQPLLKELKEKYSYDKKLYQQKVMELQKEHGNPMLGCLTVFLQIPLFIALFHVFNSLKPSLVNGHYTYRPHVGLTASQVQQITEAKLWGVSLSTAFTSKSSIVHFLGADSAHIRIFAVVMIVLMSTTTFFTQKQIMGRAGKVDPQQEMIQKIMLFGSPVMLAIFGFRFPIAVLLYWLTTNIWSMGQQFFVIRRMPPVPGLTPSGKIAGSRPDGPVEVARPAPGQRPASGKGAARAGSKAAGPSAAAGGSAGGSAAGKKSVSRAPAGTSSRSGSAGSGGAASRNGSGTNLSKPGKAAGAPGSVSGGAVPGAAGGGSAPSHGQSSNGQSSNGQASHGHTPAAGDGKPRTPPVPAGARRPSGGSRPAKKRGKGPRRGGRR